MGPDRWFLAFAAAVFVFHQLPAFAGHTLGDAIDVFTPWAVAGASAGVIVMLGTPRRAAIVALVAGLLYVQGQGIHLAANSIHNEGPVGRVEEITYFWDERFSHIEAVLGWFGLIGAFCLAERSHRRRVSAGPVLTIAAVVLGWTFFTSTVEGQTWPLQLVATALFAGWAIRAGKRDGASRPLLNAAAAAFVIGAVLIGAWALWHGGVPEFSETGLI